MLCNSLYPLPAIMKGARASFRLHNAHANPVAHVGDMCRVRYRDPEYSVSDKIVHNIPATRNDQYSRVTRDRCSRQATRQRPNHVLLTSSIEMKSCLASSPCSATTTTFAQQAHCSELRARTYPANVAFVCMSSYSTFGPSDTIPCGRVVEQLRDMLLMFRIGTSHCHHIA